ncbi:hypothetical protein FOZ62_027399, partial [Perkinsus olseni]
MLLSSSPPPPPSSSRPHHLLLQGSASMAHLHPFPSSFTQFGPASVHQPSRSVLGGSLCASTTGPISCRPSLGPSVRGPTLAAGGSSSLPVQSMTRVAVGPYVKGSTGEVYELIEQLQSALFGGVYRARGLSTGKDYAVKVLHKRELARIQREAKDNRNIEFCEMPLSEVTFASKM